MFRKIKEEGIVYISIFALSQIIMGGINPIAVGVTSAAVACGCGIIGCNISLLLGLMLVFKGDIISKYMLVMLLFSVLEFLLRKYRRNVDEINKSILLMLIFFTVSIVKDYQDLTFINVLTLLLEVLIASCSCMVLSVGIVYFKRNNAIVDMRIKEKISVALILTLLAVYIIQARQEYVTPLKVVIIYVLSFICVAVYKTIIMRTSNREGTFSYNTFTYNKLGEYAEAIRNMAKSINAFTNEDLGLGLEQGNAVFEKVSSKYCAGCDRCNICWEREFDTTYKAANLIVSSGVTNGVINTKDLPRNFLLRCKNINDLILETNAGFELEKNNIRWLKRINEVKNIMTMQLNELAESLCNFNDDFNNGLKISYNVERKIRIMLRRNDIYVRDIYYYKNRMGIKELGLSIRSMNGKIIKSILVASIVSEVLGEKMELSQTSRETIKNTISEIVLVQKTVYELATHFKGMKKEGEILCGDNYAVINGNCGQSAMILSDGMGTGRVAFEESKKTIEMVEEFLTAGFAKDIAIKLVNSAMYMNSFESNMYATIDIAVVDNYTGECEFIKNGAAPTFIKRGKDVKVINSNSLPIGVFNNADYDVKKIQLKNGDVIVMITDGLEESIPKYLDSTNEIKYILQSIESNNPKTIAGELLSACLDNESACDDISILVGIIWKK